MHLSSNSNAMGILLMVLAMAIFAITDTLVKLASSSASPAQVMFLMIGGGLVMFFLIAKMQGAQIIDRRVFVPVLLVRYLAEIVAMIGIVMALAYVPLSTVGAIMQAVPLLVTLGAVLFLGEKVSWRRWTAIFVGFAGVLLILQPGAEGYDVSVLWAVVAIIGLSARDLTTRLTPSGMATSSLAGYTMAASLPFSMIWLFAGGEDLFPANGNWLIIFTMIIMGSVGYLVLISSIRMADISTVSPFRYSRLIFMILLGIFVFGERPGLHMLAGAALIVASGLYVMWRERVVVQEVDGE